MSIAVVRALNIACDVISVLDAVDKSCRADEQHQEERGFVEKASLINRLVLLGFSAAESEMIVHGTSSAALSILKTIELLPRAGQVCIQFQREVFATEIDEPIARDVTRIISKGLVGPIADTVRVAAEINSYDEQSYLEKLAKDPTATRPVYRVVGAGEDAYFEKIGDRPIDPQEYSAQSSNVCFQ